MEHQTSLKRDEVHSTLSSSSTEINSKYDDRILTLEKEDYSISTTRSHSEEENNTRQQIKDIEAQIHAAAKAVITSLEQEHMMENQDLVPRLAPGENFRNMDLANNRSSKTYITNRSSSEIENLSENGTGDSSSQHDVAIDDDVFSYSHQSKRSSWNSYQEHINPEDTSKIFLLPADVGEEVGINIENITSSVSNRTSPRKKGSPTRKVAKNVSRSAFRTPSSVRAIQMSSPIASSFHSSYSAHQKMPSTSQRGNLVSYDSPTKVTPSPLKPKKEDPLVLLHLTVMPLNHTYSCLMASPELPESLKSVQKSWRLLQDKLNDTVLERGVLLAHPQDSYEILEERLLEALELPTNKRARILRCGHYMRSSSSEATSSGEEISHTLTSPKLRKNYKIGCKLCDICGREIRQDFEDQGRKFRIKIYASNGLMSAGAWAAAWREMERVDVEIEPYVEVHLNLELKQFALRLQQFDLMTDKKDEYDYRDEEILIENSFNQELEREKREEELKIEAEIREYEKREELHQRAVRGIEEQEKISRKVNEEANATCQVKIETEGRHKYENYENESHPGLNSNINHLKKTKPSWPQDSLIQLLIAAMKVVLLEKRKSIIAILAFFLILYWVLVKGTLNSLPIKMDSTISSSEIQNSMTNTDASSSLDVITTTIFQEITVTQLLQTPSTCSRKSYPTR
ncbi:putative pathway-specific nitrogen regulator [Erysiphe neolycopersici]|uniref:Putative pathway-specific nitrogen regulator n=1 Tax=Erysiphe neolycopersici TaxID=212602 RepID=A0A420I0V1_9PEZI|nr:putative pathway-specific nitrogen regulator [Erysiphe neolycopersici]